MDLNFQIPDWRLPEFQKEFLKIENRAVKLKVKPPVMTIGQEEDKEVFPGKPNSPFVRILNVQVKGESPVKDGVTFLGRIDHTAKTENGKNILQHVPGQSIPETYRQSNPDCDHCGHKRRRNTTFIVKEKSGDIKQVGSTCVQDYFGGQDVTSILFSFELLDKVEKLGESSKVETSGTYFVDHKPYRVSIKRYLEVVAAMIRVRGWIGRSEAFKNPSLDATADVAWNHDFYVLTNTGAEDIVTDKDKELADKALTWARDMAPNNDFLRNLKTVTENDNISRKEIGFAASAIGAYERAERYKKEKHFRTTSTHVGSIGDRITEKVKVAIVNTKPSQYGDGTLHIYTLTDGCGNEYTWFTTFGKLRKGEVINITGTVKKHDEFRGIKRTILTNCRINENKKKSKAKIEPVF